MLFRSVGSVEDITVALEDSLVTISTIAGSRFVGPIRDEVEKWQKDLLLFQEILSQAKRPQAVQPHLRKCFDNLVKLRFGDSDKSTDIFGMISGEGEEIPFYKMLKARNNVEKWLSSDGGVEDFMVRTLRAEVKKGWESYQEMDRKEWVRVQYVQVMITVGSIFWTFETEQVLMQDDSTRIFQNMGKWLKKNKDQLQGLTELIREDRKSVV